MSENEIAIEELYTIIDETEKLEDALELIHNLHKGKMGRVSEASIEAIALKVETENLNFNDAGLKVKNYIRTGSYELAQHPTHEIGGLG